MLDTRHRWKKEDRVCNGQSNASDSKHRALQPKECRLVLHQSTTPTVHHFRHAVCTSDDDREIRGAETRQENVESEPCPAVYFFSLVCMEN